MKKKRISWKLSLFVILVILSCLTKNADVARAFIENFAEEAKIQKVIRDYFDKRYQSRHANQVEDFRPLLDNSPQANSFLELETYKLEMEIYNAKIHHLKYTQYEYTLDFNDFVYDQDDQRATVHLAEGYNVVFEISEMISKNDPIV